MVLFMYIYIYSYTRRYAYTAFAVIREQYITVTVFVPFLATPNTCDPHPLKLNLLTDCCKYIRIRTSVTYSVETRTERKKKKKTTMVHHSAYYWLYILYFRTSRDAAAARRENVKLYREPCAHSLELFQSFGWKLWVHDVSE